MGAVVNKITITQTEVMEGETAGTYTVGVHWQLNGGSSCDYRGEYTLLLYENGKEKKSCRLKDDTGVCYTEQNFTDMHRDEKYMVILRAEQGSSPVPSQESRLLLHTFENIAGCYDGRQLTVTWDKIAEDIKKGTLTIWSDKGASHICEVPVYSNTIKLEGLGFYPSEQIYVSLSANNGASAFGPASAVLHFWEDACKMLSLDYAQDDKQTNVEIALSSWDKAEETVQIVFEKRGREILRQDAAVEADGEKFKLTADIPYQKLRKEEIAGCEVFCYRKKDGALSKMISGDNHLSFSKPEISLVVRKKKEVQIVWHYDGTEIPDFYVTDNGGKIYGSQYVIDDIEKAGQFRLAAGFEAGGVQRRGSYAVIPNVFREGYYLTETEDSGLAVCYRQDSFSQKCVTKQFSEQLFLTEPELPICSGGITLSRQDGGYLLQITDDVPVTRKDYQEFLKGIRDRAAPFGFYLLTEAVSRMAYQNVSDTLYLSCGYDEKNRLCDLRPGFVLETQTEIYMPQENPDMDKGAGFVTTYREEYAVSFPMEESGNFLEFNSFTEGFADAMDKSAYGDDSNVIYAGGLRDFLIPQARQPFYRILYPGTLPGSGESEITYPSENIILLAADSYGKMEDATDAIINDPSAVRQLNIPVMIFRGRSTLLAAIHVTFQGETKTLPVGITLGKLLQKAGIYAGKDAAPDTLRVYRRTPDGGEAEVFWNWEVCAWNKLPLINGDRVEV